MLVCTVRGQDRVWLYYTWHPVCLENDSINRLMMARAVTLTVNMTFVIRLELTNQSGLCQLLLECDKNTEIEHHWKRSWAPRFPALRGWQDDLLRCRCCEAPPGLPSGVYIVTGRCHIVLTVLVNHKTHWATMNLIYCGGCFQLHQNHPQCGGRERIIKTTHFLCCWSNPEFVCDNSVLVTLIISRFSPARPHQRYPQSVCVHQQT